MPEYLVNMAYNTPKDTEICQLTATLVDDGILIHAYSPLIGKFVKSKAIGSYKGSELNPPKWDKLKLLQLPARMVREFGNNRFSVDLFAPARYAAFEDGAIARRVAQQMVTTEPNNLWMFTEGLDEGVDILFSQPAHIPADIIDYLSRSMEKAKSFYTRYIAEYKVTATLLERRDE